MLVKHSHITVRPQVQVTEVLDHKCKYTGAIGVQDAASKLNLDNDMQKLNDMPLCKLHLLALHSNGARALAHVVLNLCNLRWWSLSTTN